MDNFLELNINIKDYLLVDPSLLLNSNTIMTYYPWHEIISSELIKKLNYVVMTPIDYCATFITSPNYTLNIHSDNGNIDGRTIWAINFVINSNDHTMIWYKTDSPSVRKINEIGIAYWHYDLDLVSIDQQQRISSALVRTDVPHNVINNDDINQRLCISLRSSKSKFSWDEVYEKFLGSEFISTKVSI